MFDEKRMEIDIDNHLSNLQFYPLYLGWISK